MFPSSTSLLVVAALTSASLAVVVERQSINPLPLGANCTTDAECGSDKCWPQYWYFGQDICSPSPAGHSCLTDSACITGSCVDNVCAKGNPDTTMLCYTTNDCVTNWCISDYLGGGQNTRCYYAKPGHSCTADHPEYCLSGVCDTSSGEGVCTLSQEYAKCYTGTDCASPYYCAVLSMSSPYGICYQNLNQA